MDNRKSQNLTEEDLASIGELYLQSKGWDCYPEVVIPIFGGRPDIVAVKGRLCLVAEVKKSLSYPVIEQLTRWHTEYRQACESEYQDESVKAIPSLMVAIVNSRPQISDLKEKILKQHRIGVWVVSHKYECRALSEYGDGKVVFNNEKWNVTEIIPAFIQDGSRATASKIIEHLNQDMKVFGRAGSTGKEGAYMTPFKRTMSKVWSFIKTLDPGSEIHLARIVDYINENGGHHYTNDGSAKNGIKAALEREGHRIEWMRLTIPNYK